MWQNQGGDTGDEGERAHESGYAFGGREHVEAPDSVSHHVDNQELWDAFERETMHSGAKALLNGTDGSLDFADVTVGGDNVKVHGVEGLPNALKFLVGMQGTDVETTSFIKADDGFERLQHRGASTVGDGADGPEVDVAGDGVKKDMSLHEEEVSTKHNLAVMLQDGGR